MNTPYLYSIVEGHGEEIALRIFIETIVSTFNPNTVFQIAKPYKISRTDFSRWHQKTQSYTYCSDKLENALELTTAKASANANGCVLCLCDLDQDSETDLIAAMTKIITPHAARTRIRCAVACPEFEAWFLACGERLQHSSIIAPIPTITQHLAPLDCKGELGKYMRNGKYDPIRHQPAFAAAFDPALARQNSPSFDAFVETLSYLLDITL